MNIEQKAKTRATLFIDVGKLAARMTSIDSDDEPWRITVGLDKPKEMVFVDGDVLQEVRICLNTQGGSGYPTRVRAKFDDDRYTPMLTGQCMFFTGKRVSVKFANPSSGKYATGTYKVIQKRIIP